MGMWKRVLLLGKWPIRLYTVTYRGQGDSRRKLWNCRLYTNYFWGTNIPHAFFVQFRLLSPISVLCAMLSPILMFIYFVSSVSSVQWVRWMFMAVFMQYLYITVVYITVLYIIVVLVYYTLLNYTLLYYILHYYDIPCLYYPVLDSTILYYTVLCS